MENLKNVFNSIKEKFSSLGKGVKITISILFGVVLISVALMFVYSPNNQYKVLFSNLDSEDAETIISKLNEQGVKVKVSGDSILVPESKVDELRLSLASEITFGSQGYELMDTSSSFGLTDEEFKLKKIRMLQGELERTIRSFSQIDDVRVHITPAKDSVFAENKEPGSAAVYLKLKTGKILSNDQVASIIALISGGSENIPKENIEVIDQNMNLISANIAKSNNEINSSDSVKNQQALKKEFENELTKTAMSLLEPVFGKGKITIAINADLDFDSKQKNEVIIDPNSVIISQEITKENISGNTNTSNSPVDNNMGNTIETEEDEDNYSNIHEITNYEVGRVENITVSAPGQIKRLTASVLIDGEIDDKTRNSIEKAITTAIGLDKERNDAVNVIGINFNQGEESDYDIFNEMENDNITKNFLIYTGIGFACIGIIALIIFLLRKNKKSYEEDEEDEEDEDIIDTIQNVGTRINVLDDKNESSERVQIEQEIRKYANEKPAQVVEVIRSWMKEDER